MCVSDIQLSRVLSIANINIFCLVFPTNCLVRWITSNHLIHWLKVKPPIKGTEVFLIEYLLPFFDIACWHTHTHTFPPPPLHTHTHHTLEVEVSLWGDELLLEVQTLAVLFI